MRHDIHIRQRLRAGLFALTALLPATGALADVKPVVLVELFTSQGCSSCPPADALIADLAQSDDILPLALHVDYWDYIGWEDEFARPEHTERQKAYARMAGERSIFTPQIVVAGTRQVIGFRPMELMEAVQAGQAALGRVDVDAGISSDGALSIDLHSHDGASLPAHIVIDLVSYTPMETVTIAHGENAGRTISYANIVQDWERLGSWDGQGGWSTKAQIVADGPIVLIVQEAGPGEVLAAMRLR